MMMTLNESNTYKAEEMEYSNVMNFTYEEFSKDNNFIPKLFIGSIYVFPNNNLYVYIGRHYDIVKCEYVFIQIDRKELIKFQTFRVGGSRFDIFMESGGRYVINSVLDYRYCRMLPYFVPLTISAEAMARISEYYTIYEYESFCNLFNNTFTTIADIFGFSLIYNNKYNYNGCQVNNIMHEIINICPDTRLINSNVLFLNNIEFHGAKLVHIGSGVYKVIEGSINGRLHHSYLVKNNVILYIGSIQESEAMLMYVSDKERLGMHRGYYDDGILYI